MLVRVHAQKLQQPLTFCHHQLHRQGVSQNCPRDSQDGYLIPSQAHLPIYLSQTSSPSRPYLPPRSLPARLRPSSQTRSSRLQGTAEATSTRQCGLSSIATPSPTSLTNQSGSWAYSTQATNPRHHRPHPYPNQPLPLPPSENAGATRIIPHLPPRFALQARTLPYIPMPQINPSIRTQAAQLFPLRAQNLPTPGRPLSTPILHLPSGAPTEIPFLPSATPRFNSSTLSHLSQEAAHLFRPSQKSSLPPRWARQNGGRSPKKDGRATQDGDVCFAPANPSWPTRSCTSIWAVTGANLSTRRLPLSMPLMSESSPGSSTRPHPSARSASTVWRLPARNSARRSAAGLGLPPPQAPSGGWRTTSRRRALL